MKNTRVTRTERGERREEERVDGSRLYEGVRHMEGTDRSCFTCPVFLNLDTDQGPYSAYENYDYFHDGKGAGGLFGGGGDRVRAPGRVRTVSTRSFKARESVLMVLLETAK